MHISNNNTLYQKSVYSSTAIKQGAAPVSKSFNYSGIELHKDALFSIATPHNGGNASAYYAEDFSEENPYIIVKGKDYNGVEYEERVDIKNVDPKNSSFIEMVALAAYMNDKGKLDSMNFLNVPDTINAGLRTPEKRSYFDKRDYISALENFKEMQLVNKNHESYLILGNQLNALYSWMDR